MKKCLSAEELAKIAVSEPVVFVAGAGVSMPAPSLLPSGRGMLDLVLRVCAPQVSTRAELQLLSDMPPELYYQSMLEVAGPAVRAIWGALTLDSDNAASASALGPNLGHIILVYLAFKHGVPLLTLNYDCRFEEAATQLGLETSLRTPAVFEWTASTAPDQTVRIWKIRGSAVTEEQLDTALHDITRLDARTRDSIVELLEAHRFCLAGYSGRDMDVFPTIVENASEQPLHWLTPRFSPDSLVDRYSDMFNITRTGILEFAAEVLTREGNGRSSRMLSLIRKRAQADSGASFAAELIASREAAMEAYVKNLLSARLKAGSPEQLLNHGLSLAMLGEHLPRKMGTGFVRGALWYLDEVLSSEPSPHLAIRALIVKAYGFSELSRYRQSEQCASEARRLARVYDIRPLLVVAMSSAASARYMQQFFSTGFGKESRLALRWKAWVEVLRQVIELRMMQSYVGSRSSEDESPMMIRARWAVLGHKIRLRVVSQRLAIALALRPTLLRLISRRLMRGWRGLEEECRAAGYAVGLANSRRYAEEMSGSASDNVQAQRLFILLVARLERVLIQLRQATDTLQKGEVDIASRAFRECVARAGEIGSCALVLRGLVGLRRCGSTLTPQDMMRAKCAIRSIEAESLEEIEDRLLKWLESDNSGTGVGLTRSSDAPRRHQRAQNNEASAEHL